MAAELIIPIATEGLRGVLGDLDDLSGGIDDVGRAADSGGKKGDGLVGKLSGMINPVGLLTTGLAALGAASLAVWSDFDAGADTIATMTGATGDALDGMSASMVALKGDAAGLGSSMEDIGTVIGTIGRETGLTGADLDKLSSKTLKLSQLTGGDAVKTGEAFSGVMKSWGLSADETAGLMDTVFTASQKMGVSVEGVTASLQKSGPALRAMGFSLDESVGLLGSFEKAGLDSNSMLKGLQTATATFAKQGVDAGTGLQGLVSSIAGAATEAEALQTAVDYFGAKSGPAFAEAIRSGTLDLQGLTGALAGSQGSIDSTLDSTLDFSDKWEIFTSGAATKLIPLGQALNDLASAALPLLSAGLDAVMLVFNSVSGAVTGLVSGISSFFGAVEGGSDPLKTITDALTGLGVLLGETIGTAVTNLQAIWAEVWPEVQAAVMPVLEAVFGELSRFWTEIEPKLSAVWATIQSVIEAVMPIVQNIIGAGLEFVGNLWENVWPGMAQQLEGVWQLIQGVVQVAWGIVSGIISAGLSLLSGDWEGAWAAIKDAAATVWEGIQNIVQGAWNILEGAVTAGLGVLQTVWDAIWGAISGKVTEIWDTITSTVQTQIDNAKTTIDAVTLLISNAWNSFWDNVSTKVTEIWDSITGTIQTQIDTAKTTIDATVLLIQTAWDTFWGNIWTTVSTTWDTISTGIGTKLGEIKTLIEGVPENLKQAVLGIGTSIVGGIIEGLQNAWGTIEQTIADLAANLPQPIKDALGIHSPSDEMATEVGDPITMGILQGIRDSWPALISGVEDLIDSLIYPFSRFREYISNDWVDDISAALNYAMSTGIAGSVGNFDISALMQALQYPLSRFTEYVSNDWAEDAGGAFSEYALPAIAARIEGDQSLGAAWWNLLEPLLIHMRDEWAPALVAVTNELLDKDNASSLAGMWWAAWEKRREGGIPEMFKQGLSEMFGQAVNFRNQIHDAVFTNTFFAGLGELFGQAQDWASEWGGAMDTMASDAEDAARRIAAAIRSIPPWPTVPADGGRPQERLAGRGLGAASYAPAPAYAAAYGAAGGAPVTVNVYIDDVPIDPRKVSIEVGERQRMRHR